MKTIATTTLAILIVVACGVVHGVISNRWSDSNQELQQAVARLNRVPKTVGDWKTEYEHEISARELAVGEIDGYLSRTYVNRKAGKSVSVIIVCGHSGPISVHTPDICFRGQGLRQIHEQQTSTVEDQSNQSEAEFWRCDFGKQDDNGISGLRAYWTWTTDGNWSAPSNPRYAFAGQSYLYKMYVTQAVNLRPDADTESDPAQEFIAAWLPELNNSLFPAAENAGGGQPAGNNSPTKQSAE